MNFRDWIKNEIAGVGDYESLVPGWRGSPKGPFTDPKRMEHDPLFWRNYAFKKQQAAAELEKAKSELKADPKSREAKEKYGQAMAGSLWSAMPTVREAKPRGEYQGHANWDTWAVMLWATNERESYETLRRTARSSMSHEKKLESIRRYLKRHKREIDDIAGDEDTTVDWDVVDWESILSDFAVD